MDRGQLVPVGFELGRDRLARNHAVPGDGIPAVPLHQDMDHRPILIEEAVGELVDGGLRRKLGGFTLSWRSQRKAWQE